MRPAMRTARCRFASNGDNQALLGWPVCRRPCKLADGKQVLGCYRPILLKNSFQTLLATAAEQD